MTRTLLLTLLVTASASAQAPADAAGPVAPPPRRPVSLFSDVRAYQAGDLLTVILAERTQARRQSRSNASRTNQIAGSGSATMGGFFGVDAQVGAQSDADNQTVQSDLLAGTITARVVAVDAAGNLQIEGERRLDVDGAVHLMSVSGLVRPADVSTGNTVLSHQIAGADVAYRQEGGGGSKFLQPRFLTLVGTAAVLIGAVVFGTSAGS